MCYKTQQVLQNAAVFKKYGSTDSHIQLNIM